MRVRTKALDCWLSENFEDLRRLLIATGGILRIPVFDLFGGTQAISGMKKGWAASEDWHQIEGKSTRPRRALRLFQKIIDNELEDGRLEVQVKRSKMTGKQSKMVWTPLAKLVAENSFVSSSPARTHA